MDLRQAMDTSISFTYFYCEEFSLPASSISWTIFFVITPEAINLAPLLCIRARRRFPPASIKVMPVKLTKSEQFDSVETVVCQQFSSSIT